MRTTCSPLVLLTQLCLWLPGQAPDAAAPPAPADLSALVARGVPIHGQGIDSLHGPLGIWAPAPTTSATSPTARSRWCRISASRRPRACRGLAGAPIDAAAGIHWVSGLVLDPADADA